MADVEITQDLFSHHDPTGFKEEGLRDLRKKHGKVPRWLNRRYRHMRGLDGFRYVKLDDPIVKDLLPALRKDPYEIEQESEDGMIRHGDVVLGVRDVELNDRRRMQNHLRANRGMGKDELASELRRISPDVKIDPASFEKLDRPEKQPPARSQAVRGGRRDGEHG